MESKQFLKAALRRAYKYLPLKQRVFWLLKKVWTPPQSIYRHLHFHGIFPVALDERSFFLIQHHGYEFENSVFWSGLGGDWEGTSMRLWMQLCREHSVIYDVGANTGIFSLVAKTVNPKAEVHAFEPVRRVFEKLVHNNNLNSFDIRCVGKALSDQTGSAIVYDQDSDHIYSVTINKNLSPKGTKVFPVEIETMRLDSYCEAQKLRPPTLIKLDVETHEPEVLLGMGELVRLSKPDFLIEILNEEVGERVEAILRPHDYLYFNIGEKGEIRRQEKLGKSDHWNFLICSPKTAASLNLN